MYLRLFSRIGQQMNHVGRRPDRQQFFYHKLQVFLVGVLTAYHILQLITESFLRLFFPEASQMFHHILKKQQLLRDTFLRDSDSHPHSTFQLSVRGQLFQAHFRLGKLSVRRKYQS